MNSSGVIATVPADADELTVVSDAAGRMRVQVPWVRGDSRRAVAAEEAAGRRA